MGLAPFGLFAALITACGPTATSTPGESPPAEPEPAPTSVMAHAIYAPNPDQKALQDTVAARFHKSDGSVVIGFCIDVHGRVGDLEVVESFPGDPMVDEILLETVATWRFEPFTVDGRPIKTCSQKTFNLHFKAGPPRSPVPSVPLGPLPDSLSRDICVHMNALMSAATPEAETEAELERALHLCFESIEAKREAVGDEEFERVGRCVLAATTLETMVTCGQ